MAFGLGHHTPGWLLVPATAAVAALAAAVVWRRASGSGVAAGLFVGGLLANAVDRALGGSVVELLHIGWWPPINVAEILLTVGLVLLLSDVMSKGHDAGQAARPPPSDAIATSSRETPTFPDVIPVAAIRWRLRIVSAHSLAGFGWYRLVAAVVTLGLVGAGRV